jgi:hypothetical protein
MRYYLAGPMTGYPQHNIPAFHEAAQFLRSRGYDVVSPAELDDQTTVDLAMSDMSGDIAKLDHTWGDLLARDVKLIADGCNGIILLPRWYESKGARLEAFVAVSCGYPTEEYYKGVLIKASHKRIMKLITKGVL